MLSYTEPRHPTQVTMQSAVLEPWKPCLRCSPAASQISENNQYRPTLAGFARHTSQPRSAGCHFVSRCQKKKAFPQGHHSGAVHCWRSPAAHHIMSQWLIAMLETPAISERVTRKKKYTYINLDCSQWHKRKHRKCLTQCPCMNVANLHGSFKERLVLIWCLRNTKAHA